MRTPRSFLKAVIFSATLLIGAHPALAALKPFADNGTYDDQGRRISKSVGGGTTQFLYNGPDIVAEYPSNWGTAIAQYTHGPNPDEPIERITPTMAQYYHHDGLGSVEAVSNNSNGAVDIQRFDAWGNQIAQSGTQPRYGYTGRELDETGLIFFRSRYLDPSIGRFTQRDPIGLQGGINQYAYVNNNPLNFTDPSGNFPQAIQMAEADLNRSYAPVINYQTSTGTQSLATLYHRDDSNDFAGKAVDTLSSLLPGAGVVEAFSQASEGNIGMAVLALATEIPAFKGLKAESRVLGAVEREGAGGGILFGQQSVSRTFTSAEKGSTFEFAGSSIADAAAGLRNGGISPNQIPVEFVMVNGQQVAFNNRSLTALRRAGIEPTNTIDVSADPYKLNKVMGRINEMGGARSTIQIRGAGSNASAIY